MAKLEIRPVLASRLEVVGRVLSYGLELELESGQRQRIFSSCDYREVRARYEGLLDTHKWMREIKSRNNRKCLICGAKLSVDILCHKHQDTDPRKSKMRAYGSINSTKRRKEPKPKEP